ncbi:MAG: hypothetical protein AAB686_01455 [Patescibacteria group bacterium]
MLQFIFANIFLLAIGAILYLTVRSLPRIGEERMARSPGLLERWVTSDVPHKIDLTVSSYAGKFFRKLKVVLMRMDNYLTTRLKKMGSEKNDGLNGQAKPKIDFSELGSTSGGKDIGKKNGDGESKD